VRRPFLVLAAAAGVLAGVPAAAQTVFVAGAAGVSVQQFDDGTDFNRLDGLAPTFAIGGGVEWRSFIVQAEASMDLSISDAQALPLTVGGQPLTIRSTLDHTVNSVSLLGGYEFELSTQLALRALGGVATSSVTRTFTTNAPIVILTSPSAPAALVTTTGDRFAQWTLAADLLLRRTPRVQFVAGLRIDPLHLQPDIEGQRVRVLGGLTWTSR
jgi:hypothetical protein